MSAPLFSIIVPVYNVEKFLPECVDSILSQTFRDFELILVDDGSSDSSGNICDSYSSDARVRVVHKSNGGSASARNAGIDLAQGEYLLFMDSDDYWCNSCALEILHQGIVHAVPDALLFGCKVVWSDGSERLSRYSYGTDAISPTDVEAVLSRILSRGHFPGAAWILCARRSVVTEHGIHFPEGVVAEDILWLTKLLAASHSVTATDEVLYAYRRGREGQLTSRSSLKGSLGMIMAIDFWLNNDRQQGCGAISSWLANIYLVLLVNYHRLSSADRRSIKNKIMLLSDILKSGGRTHQVVRSMIKVGGIGFTATLLSLAHSIRSNFHA